MNDKKTNRNMIWKYIYMIQITTEAYSLGGVGWTLGTDSLAIHFYLIFFSHNNKSKGDECYRSA